MSAATTPSAAMATRGRPSKAGRARSTSKVTTCPYFVLENNLFVGPAAPDQGKTVSWEGPIDHGTLDFNG